MNIIRLKTTYSVSGIILSMYIKYKASDTQKIVICSSSSSFNSVQTAYCKTGISYYSKQTIYGEHVLVKVYIHLQGVVKTDAELEVV